MFHTCQQCCKFYILMAADSASITPIQREDPSTHIHFL